MFSDYVITKFMVCEAYRVGVYFVGPQKEQSQQQKQSQKSKSISDKLLFTYKDTFCSPSMSGGYWCLFIGSRSRQLSQGSDFTESENKIQLDNKLYFVY